MICPEHRELMEPIATCLKCRDAERLSWEKRMADANDKRDSDWINAFAFALGTNSGLAIPTGPDGVRGFIDRMRGSSKERTGEK